MVQARPQFPEGHGEVLIRPEYASWAALVERNRTQASEWDFTVGGLPVAAFRHLARVEALERASAFSARMGVAVDAPGEPDAPIVATGHQPDLYHPGVWAKDFLVDRIGKDVGATAIDVVVDSDTFDVVQVAAPCWTPSIRRCHQYLAVGSAEMSFHDASVPSAKEIDDFCTAASDMLASLPVPAVKRHFDAFCDDLRLASHGAANLAELVTFARRRYEDSAGTSYLELPVTLIAASSAFARFVAHVALDAERFAGAFNAELADFRTATRARSNSQPFPDLRLESGSFELPFWLLREGVRQAVWATPQRGGGVELHVADHSVARLPSDVGEAAEELQAIDGVLAPRALALTLFVRMFVCDLFIHGVGGGRYDRVTDGLIRRYFGVEPPEFAVASMTMYLPLGGHLVTEQEVAEATEALNRFEHNPDQFLGEAVFDSADEERAARALADEKRELRAAIAAPDADKKTIGRRIREVNAELGEVLAPLGAELKASKERLESQRGASEIFEDRTYPFAFWSPSEVADKVG